MISKGRIVAAALLAISIAACETTPRIAAVEGPVPVGKSYTVTLEPGWNRIADRVDGNRTRGDMLTKDGPSLNIIRLISGLESGDYIIKPASKEFPTPTFNADMTELEIVEFLSDTASAFGFVDVATRDVQPAAFGTADGISFGLDAVTTRGLNMKGEVRVAKINEELQAILFIAPEAHYYNALKPEVARIMNSIVLTTP